MKNVIIIFGYNNTRIYDIERIKRYANADYQAEIMLCKESISDFDKAITPYALTIDFDKRDDISINQQIQAIDLYVKEHELTVIGCLPFSDKGIVIGSYYARYKHLAHDSCERAHACIDKFAFRQLEKAASTPSWYRKPFFARVYSYDEAYAIVANATFPLFFKPTQEGNSRGCIQINSLNDLAENKDALSIYFKQGVLIEECIQGCDEFSFDGVNGNYVITEKKTSSGRYRVETQHLLPAPLTQDHYQRLLEAGKIVATISGSRNGAVHNELFLNTNTGEVYCVEPNRRPAGLKLWDWVSESYSGMDNWKRWIDWACSKSTSTEQTQRSYFTGCKMLQADSSGILSAVDSEILQRIQSRQGVVDIAITKKQGASVTRVLKDNSDFVGYVVCKAESEPELRTLLNHMSRQAMTALSIQ